MDQKGRREDQEQDSPLYEQDTAKDIKTSSAYPFPQPPQGPPPGKESWKKRWYISLSLAIAFLLILSVGILWAMQLRQQSGVWPISTSAVTALSAATASATAATLVPGRSETAPAAQASGVMLGPQACPPGAKDLTRWASIIGVGSDRQVEGVSCANIMGNSSLQALVNVRHNNVNRMLDVYVFDNIAVAKPAQFFTLSGLMNGDAKISYYNTVMTAQVDPNSTVNAGKSVSAMNVDLFREFDWSARQGTLVQVAFPGIFPDLTRYQAEADQVSVNNGHSPWKRDAASVAQTTAITLLKWSNQAQATVFSGGGSRDIDAVVHVQSTSPDHSVIQVSLSRLEGNARNMWVVVGVQSNLMSITSPQRGALLSSPVVVKGAGSAFEGDVGTVFMLDHLYNGIGHAKGVPATGMGNTTFTATVTYNANFPGGAQEGVLAFYRYSAVDGAIAGAVLQKELFIA
jgi:hypothetical protein